MNEIERFFEAAHRTLAVPLTAGLSVEDRLDRVEDETEIRRVLAAYTYYYDGGDFAALSNVFADDAVLHNLLGEHKGIDAVIAAVSQLGSLLEVRRHLITNVTIALTGPNSAESVCYLFSVAQLTKEAARAAGGLDRLEYIATGGYVDRLERRDVGWRIVERRISAPFGHRVESFPDNFDRFASLR